ncbi:MAG: hypothetical protein EXQ85_02355 [Alphaproteobacteria bacterium]|nr:hypothetical protein [Alphaproteobacteria bacterium]
MTTANGKLGRSVAATMAVPDFDATLAAYRRYFGYELRAEGTVAPALAESWAAPAVGGQRFAILGPANGKDVFIRLVHGPHPPTYVSLRTSAWAAIEIAVADVDRLAADLRGSPFTTVGAPRDIAIAGAAIRAMQVRGPANEILIFTQIMSSAPDLPLPTVTTGVDQIFVAVLGCSDFERAKDFYGNKFLTPTGPDLQALLHLLSEAFGLDRPTKHTLTTLALPDRTFLELDEYSEAAVRRTAVPGFLPPSVALMTFEHRGTLDDLPLYSLAEPTAYADKPYSGRRQVTFYGGTGEMIELIQAAA